MTDDHDLSGAYVVDALDAHERARFEAHLERCPQCRDEVRDLRETLATLAAPTAQAPATELRGRVLAAAAATPQERDPAPPETDQVPQETDPAPQESSPVRELSAARTARLRHRIRTAVLTASAAAALVIGGTLAWQEWSPSTPMTEQVMLAQDADHMEGAMSGGGQIALVRSSSMEQAVIMGKDLPAPRAGYAYQAWVKDSQGTMHPDAMVPMDGQPALLKMPLADAMEVGVTVEPMTGSAEPTSEVIATITLVEDPAPPSTTEPVGATAFGGPPGHP